MIDSHAHIHDKQYDDDRDAIVARAREVGVTQIVTVGCDIADSARALAAARAYGEYASVGVHPHEAIDAPEDLANAFAPLLDDSRCVAIGETGLDYFYDHSPRDVQQTVLRKQLSIARERDLPVIFHQRDAYDDFLTILREEFTPGMRGVIHCFTGDTTQAQTYVSEFGLLLGIGGVVTFKSAQMVRDAVRAIGPDALIFETDAPYLAPVPLRGKRNEPAFMAKTAAFVADLLERPLDEVVAQADARTRALFKIGDS